MHIAHLSIIIDKCELRDAKCEMKIELLATPDYWILFLFTAHRVAT